MHLLKHTIQGRNPRENQRNRKEMNSVYNIKEKMKNNPSTLKILYSLLVPFRGGKGTICSCFICVNLAPGRCGLVCWRFLYPARLWPLALSMQ